MKLKIELLLISYVQIVLSQTIFFVDDENCCEQSYNNNSLYQKLNPIVAECDELVNKALSILPPVSFNFFKLTNYMDDVETREDIDEECYLSCAATKLGLVDGNLNLDPVAMKAFAKDNIMSTSWELQSSDTWVVDCVNEASDDIQALNMANELKCTHRLGAFNDCIWQKRFDDCPAEKQINWGMCFLWRYKFV